MAFIDPDNTFIDPDDQKSDDAIEFAKDIGGKIWAGATLPIRGAASLGMGAGAGAAGLAYMAGGGSPEKAGEAVQQAMGAPFNVLQTDASQKATEAIGDVLYGIPKDITETVMSRELGYDPNAPAGSIQANPLNEAKARAQGAMGFDAAMFGGLLRGMRGSKAPAPSPEAREAARRARQLSPPPPSPPGGSGGTAETRLATLKQQVRNATGGAAIPSGSMLDHQLRPLFEEIRRLEEEIASSPPPEFRPSPMPLKPGEQGQLFPEPLRGPEGPQGELFPRPARTPEELRIDDTTRQPLQETIEPPRPPASELLSLEEKTAGSTTRLNEARAQQLDLLKQEAAASLRRGDTKGYEDAMKEVNRLREPETIEPPVPEAMSRNLFEQPPEPRVIEKQGFPERTGSEFSEFERAKLPKEVGPWDDQYRAFVGEPSPLWGVSPLGGVGKKQGGAIDFTFRRNEGKKIPLKYRLRIANQQYEDILREKNKAYEGKLKATTELEVARANKELKFYGDQLDRAQEFVSSLTDISVRPKAEVVPLGQTKRGDSQKGSIGFKEDPDFLKFKAALPKEQQKWAKSWYKTLQAEEKGKATLTPTDTQNAQLKAANAVPGLKDGLKYIEPIEGKTPTEVAQMGLAEPDLNFKLLGGALPSPKWLRNQIGRGLTPGAALTAFGKRNSVVQYLAQETHRAKIAANRLKHELLLDEKTGLQPLINKLSSPERAWGEMAKVEGKDTPVDTSRLTPAEIATQQATRTVLNKLLDEMNVIRKALGFTKDIERRPNYLPGVFSGDFQVEAFKIHTKKDGTIYREMVGRYPFNDRYSAEFGIGKIRDKYASDPSVVVESVKQRPMSRLEMKDANQVFSSLEDMLGDSDPMFQTLREIKEAYLLEGPYEYAGVRKHFMPKKREGVSGARGFNPLLDAKKNAKEGFEATLQYAEAAIDWIEMQKLGMKIKDILKNEELRSEKPELMKYVDFYWRTVSKQGTLASKVFDALSHVGATISGVGESHIRDTTRMIKSGLTLSYLTTPTFLGVQALQPIQMMPTWMAYITQKAGGNPGHTPLAMSLGAADMTMLIHKEGMSPLGKQAYEWAKTNQALVPHMLDDIRPDTLSRTFGGLRDLASAPLRYAEELTRAYSFLGYSHFLELAGMERGPHMFETAINLTNMSMTDYRLHERPLVYQQLGVIGEAMSTLTAFKHNNYGQFLSMVEKGKQGTNIPWVTMAGMGLLLSGVSGMWFREDIDNIITAINDHVWSGPEPIPTTMGYMLKNLPDELTFGGVSTLTGMDLSSRFSQARMLPEMGAGTVFPYTKDVLARGESLVNLAKNPSKTTAVEAAYANSPNAFKGFIEKGAQVDPRIAPDIKRDTGGFDRDKSDWRARYLGGRSLREARSAIENNQFKMGERFRSDMKAKILDQAAKNPGARQALAAKYAKLSDSYDAGINEFNRRMQQHEMDKHTTPEEKILMKAGQAPRPAQRRMDFK